MARRETATRTKARRELLERPETIRCKVSFATKNESLLKKTLQTIEFFRPALVSGRSMKVRQHD